MQLAKNTGRNKSPKNSPSGHHGTTYLGYILATTGKACIDNRKKKLVKQHMSSQYGKLRPTSGCDRFISLGHPSKFQRVSHLGFITTATLLNGSQPNFARCLAVSWTGTLCTFSADLAPQRGTPPFSAHICCGQMAGWIKMPLGREVGLGPSNIMLDGDPSPPPQKGGRTPNFRPMSIVAKWLDGSRWHLAWT